MHPAALRALVVGAVTWDRVADHPEAPPVPGGAVTFAGRTLARLGCRVRVVTRVAEEDAATVLAPLRQVGAEVAALPARRTTRYVNRYGDAERPDRHDLRERSDPVVAGDVPTAWLESAQLVHAGPLHPDDVDPAALAGAAGLVGVDLQGLVRGADAPATPRAARPRVMAWAAVATVMQASHDDATVLFGTADPAGIQAAVGVAELLVTRGIRGAVLVTPDGAVEIPAQPVRGGDVRGAGDVHLAVYLTARALGRTPPEAARRAAAATASAIRTGRVDPSVLG